MYYKYKVTYWNCADTKEAYDEGLVHAKSYGKAATKVLNEYGENCVIDIYLMEIDTMDCINKEDIDFSFKTN